jgi:CheY-like chemotaxis protein
MRDILIVEDGLHERERLSRLFQAAGYTVSTAEGVDEAQLLLDSDSFRLAVLDVGLGDKSGSLLFDTIKRSGAIPYVIIFTGNPSVHLKQRFLDEGAVAYIVKASAEAQNDAFMGTVRSFLGEAAMSSVAPVDPQKGASGKGALALEDFLDRFVSETSRALFLEQNNQFPQCTACGSTDYEIVFSHKTQLPPLIEGKVVCVQCKREMDPEIG